MLVIRKNKFAVVGFVLFILLLIMAWGAVDTVNRGGGFLFIPSFTPTSTNTPTLTDTPTTVPTDTATPTETVTLTPSLTNTLTPTLTLTASMTPTETLTPIPTYDITALAQKIYSEVTAAAEAYALLQTPSITPIIPDAELYTGLRMVNPGDSKDLYFVQTGNEEGIRGFWLDWNEVTNGEYAVCVNAGYCSAPQSDLLNDAAYYSDIAFQNFPVVNITWGQANAYCLWAGMMLPTLSEWMAAHDSIPFDAVNTDNNNGGPWSCDIYHPDLVGNVWEWLDEEDNFGDGIIAGGSWKTAVQDIRGNRLGRMSPNQYSDDLGFRCVLRVVD